MSPDPRYRDARRTARAGWLTTVAVAAAAGVSACEVVEVRVPSQPSGEAASNPFHAAQEMLNQMGVPARREFAVPTETYPGDVIVYTRESTLVRIADSAALVAACDAGAIVVTFPPDVPPGDRAEIDIWGVNGIVLGEPLGQVERVVDQESSTFKLSASAPRARALSTSQPASTAWTTESGLGFVVSIPCLEGGEIIAVADPTIFENDSIGQHGRAAAFWTLTGAWDPSEVVFVAGGGAPEPMASLLWSRARPLAVALAILGVVVALSLGGVFGPPIEDPPPGSRRLGEHLAAAGRFAWRWGHEEGLLEALRRRVRARRTFSPSDIRQIAGSIGVDEAAIHDALAPPPPPARRRGRAEQRLFTRRVQILQRISQSESPWK